MSKYDIHVHESSTRCTRIIIFNDYSHLKHDLLSEHAEKLLGKQQSRGKMAFVKEENKDVIIEEVFFVKNEDAEQQTGWSMKLLLLISRILQGCATC